MSTFRFHSVSKNQDDKGEGNISYQKIKEPFEFEHETSLLSTMLQLSNGLPST